MASAEKERVGARPRVLPVPSKEKDLLPPRRMIWGKQQKKMVKPGKDKRLGRLRATEELGGGEHKKSGTSSE